SSINSVLILGPLSHLPGHRDNWLRRIMRIRPVSHLSTESWLREIWRICISRPLQPVIGLPVDVVVDKDVTVGLEVIVFDNWVEDIVEVKRDIPKFDNNNEKLEERLGEVGEDPTLEFVVFEAGCDVDVDELEADELLGEEVVMEEIVDEVIVLLRDCDIDVPAVLVLPNEVTTLEELGYTVLGRPRDTQRIPQSTDRPGVEKELKDPDDPEEVPPRVVEPPVFGTFGLCVEEGAVVEREEDTVREIPLPLAPGPGRLTLRQTACVHSEIDEDADTPVLEEAMLVVVVAGIPPVGET
ncbi:MAG: hypothetical protein Q9218_001136, partial [Villophora microphyllina]